MLNEFYRTCLAFGYDVCISIPVVTSLSKRHLNALLFYGIHYRRVERVNQAVAEVLVAMRHSSLYQCFIQ
jgi:hypothetical protein